VGLTVGWLIRLFRRRDPQFHRLRSAAVLTTLGAQPVFLFFPCAPPRTLDHFVDTIVEVSGVDLDRGVEGQDGAILRDLPLARVFWKGRASAPYRVAERLFPSLLGLRVGAFAIKASLR
jgi:hypothetical protein